MAAMSGQAWTLAESVINCLCYNAEQTHRILQDIYVSEEKGRFGTQHEPSIAPDTEDQEQNLQLFNKYVNILSVCKLSEVLSC